MAKLTAKDRAGLKASTFGLPGKRAYPMPDKSHARFALAMAHHASPVEQVKIKAKAHRVLGLHAGKPPTG